MAARDELTDRLRELRRSLDALPEVAEPPKSTLRILGATRSEQNWNTFLAYFLDPSQPHGFGTDLLKSFLETVNQETDTKIDYFHRDLTDATVETEVTSSQNNRLDILIRVPDEWFVCIESKVEASEGERQTDRYIDDTHLGTEAKSEYPEDGQHYVFLSKAHAPDAAAAGFEDLYWRHIVDAFNEKLRLSHGRYPERSVSQLEDFLSTIIMVTSMEDDDFTTIQKEKVQLLSEYRADIDKLLDAADALRQRSIEEWPDLFRREVDDELLTDNWHLREGENGCIFRDGWYLDDDDLTPTVDYEATWGDTGFRLHFVHLIRNEESFTRGTLTYILRSPTNVDLRDEFHRLYTSDRWQAELAPLLDEREITNRGNKRDYTRKTYDVDQAGLPESYFDTLATAFEEHLPIAEIADEILADAVVNVRDS